MTPQRRLLPVLVACNSIAIVGLAFLLVFAFQTRGEQVEQINAERERNVITNCEDINVRHDRTIAELDAVVNARARARPDQAARLRESRGFTVLLIEALVPKRDCAALALRQVRNP